MKFVYTGQYREFRGYVFCNGKPVTVTDGATLSALRNQPDFKEIEDEEAKASPAPEVLKGKSCEKCGKLIPRGWYMHQKWCKS